MNSPSDEISALQAAAIEIATATIAEHGSFFPFGLTIGRNAADDEEFDLLEVEPEEGDELGEEDALNGLIEHLTEESDNLRAVAVVFDTEMDDEWDAITVLLGHLDGQVLDVQAPYRTSGTKRIFGELEQTEGSLEIWD
jgi:hypothetical protein